MGEQDITLTSEKLEDTEEDIQNLQDKLNEILPSIEEIESKIEERNEEIEELENIIKNAEERIYGDFAERVGIDDIHEYEEKHLRIAKEKAQRRLEFSNTISKLENQLQYEKSRNLEEILAAEQQQIEEDKEKLL